MGWYCPRCGHEATSPGVCPRDGEPLAQVSTHDLLGRRVGEYIVLASLGGGSFGAVYRAVHTRSGMLVAIKLLYQSIDSEDSKRVLIEARAAAMLSHPNVVQVYDLAMTSDRRPYIVMQLLEGQPLSQLMVQRLPVATALSIAIDVLSALDVAHRRGVIHRDLKPDNIFIANGRAVIVDFGLAKLIGDPRAPSLTMTGEALGTPAYMAPEQVRGELADGRADLYAIGCLLFEALAGRPPFEGTATFAIFDAHLHATPPRITELRSDVPVAVEAVVLRALAKDPGSRFASAAEMQRALTTVPRRRRWPLAVAGALTLAGIATTAALVAPPEDKRAIVPDARIARHFTVPLLFPDEPPADPQLEKSLEGMVALFERGNVPHADLVRMRCSVQQVYANPPPATPPTMRAWIRRYVELIHDYDPDLDPAIECPKQAEPPPQTHKIPTPGPLPDELPRRDNLEQWLETMNDQLAAGRIDRALARTMHCEQVRQRTESVAALGTERREIRGFHRRADLLFEAYHPGVTERACR